MIMISKMIWNSLTNEQNLAHSKKNSVKTFFLDKETARKLPKRNLQKNVAVVNFTPNDSSRSISYTT